MNYRFIRFTLKLLWILFSFTSSSNPAIPISSYLFDYLSQSAQSSIMCTFACYLVNKNYKGPLFQLRNSVNGNISNFYSDNTGNLGLAYGAKGMSLKSWLGNSAKPYVVVWYDQSGNSKNAYQNITNLQPILNSSFYFVDFKTSAYMFLNRNNIVPLGNNKYTIVAQHHSIKNNNGGIFGVGNNVNNQGLNLRRNSGGYMEYWYSNDHTFGTYAIKNVISETYDLAYRRGYINSVLINSMASVNRVGGNSIAVLGKTTGDVTMNGELYNLFISNLVLNTTDRKILEGIIPTVRPTISPTYLPTKPSIRPTFTPTYTPTSSPSINPTIVPTGSPTISPSAIPSTVIPSGSPSRTPTAEPTNAPTTMPSFIPTFIPSISPSSVPTAIPSTLPSQSPSLEPTYNPSSIPSVEPTYSPSVCPSFLPTISPTGSPTNSPTEIPSGNPSETPSAEPTKSPTESPSFSPTSAPSVPPSSVPTTVPTTSVPTYDPSQSPSPEPTNEPSCMPTAIPSGLPTTDPSYSPSGTPSSSGPTFLPTLSPSSLPSQIPSIGPTTDSPTESPSSFPSVCPSMYPTTMPSIMPTSSPSLVPSLVPSVAPSNSPSAMRTDSPSASPSFIPSGIPSFSRSVHPTTLQPTFSGPNRLQILNRQDFRQKINPNNKLLLSGLVWSEKDCVARWTQNSSGINVVKQSLTPTTALVTARTNFTLNLYIPANVLIGSNTYVFALSCDRLSTLISIITNGPPSSGNFSISPTSGLELKDSFLFKASSWYDIDLPISYQFGFKRDGASSIMVIQDYSLSKVGSSLLPSGSENSGYTVNCIAQIFDSLGCFVSRYENVVVKPMTKSVSAISAAVLQLTSNNASINQISQTIIVAGSILNNVDCSLSINCFLVGRQNCSSVPHTCGACLSGYTGESGSHNSPCIRANWIKLNNLPTITSCKSDADCSFLKICDIRTGNCNYSPKQCPNDCSMRGNCSYTNAFTGTSLSICLQFSSDCIATCKCFGGYGGLDCSLTAQELMDRQNIRSDLLAHLSTITVSSNKSSVNANSIQSWASSLTCLTQASSELSEKSSAVALDIARTILSTAVSMKSVSYDSLSNVVDSINSISQSSQQNAQGESIKSLLGLYNALTLNDMVSGQSSVTNIQNNFRTTVNLVNTNGPNNAAIESPQSLLEMDFSNSQPNRIRLNLTASPMATFLKVSLVEVASKLYGNKSDLYMSNSLSIKLVGLNSLQVDESSKESTVIVHLQSNNAHYFDDVPMNFTTTCQKGKAVTKDSFICPQSDFVISHNCTGRNGNLVSYCPILQPVCVISNVSPNIGKCIMVEYTPITTICSCTIIHQIHNSSASHRNLISAEVQNVMDDSGIMDLVSMAEYVGSEFADTFYQIVDFASPDAFRKSLTVILLFCSLWIGGISLILFCGWRRKRMGAKNKVMDEQVQRKAKSAQISHSPAVICANLQDYISEIFPSVFSQESRIRRIVNEVKKHHRYLNILTASPGDFGDRSRILTGIHLLTIQTLLMFLLAVFYDLQAPSDDGSCEQYFTKNSCLSRKTYLDVTQTYCQWTGVSDQIQSSDGKIPCQYQDPTVSLQVMFFIAVIVSITTSLFLRPIDKVFQLLSAPLADAAKVKKVDTTMKRIARRVSSAARRVSVIASDTASSVAKRIGGQRLERLIAGTSTIMIPESTKSAHHIAQASMALVTSNAEAKLKSLQSNQRNQKAAMKISAIEEDREEEDSENSDDRDDNKMDGEEEFSTNKIHREKKMKLDRMSCLSTKNTSSIADFSTDELFFRLSDDIACQRRYLKSWQCESFDNQWGIDPTGEFVKGEKSWRNCFRTRGGAEENIKKEMDLVKRVLKTKVEKLNLATDQHIGLEMMHLFVMDLLGRETPAARIFESKSREDFIHTQVITTRTRVFCYLFLVLLNFFFVLYAILRGYSKGQEWQYAYLVACLSQILVEMLLFETIECIWIQFFVPNLVADEVRRVNGILTDSIVNLCSNHNKEDDDNNNSLLLLDAPEYLFISTNLAKTYPKAMESVLVLSYHSYLPGELAKKWQLGVSARIRRHNEVHQSTLMLTMLVLLQGFATMPFLMHQMFVRFAQPFFLFGLVSLGTLIVHNVLYTALVATIVFVIVMYLLYLYFNQKKRQNNNRVVGNISIVQNVVESSEEEIVITDFDLQQDYQYHCGDDESQGEGDKLTIGFTTCNIDNSDSDTTSKKIDYDEDDDNGSIDNIHSSDFSGSDDLGRNQSEGGDSGSLSSFENSDSYNNNNNNNSGSITNHSEESSTRSLEN